jgi:hypothetical protein
MIRRFAIGLISLSLAACGTFSKPHGKRLHTRAPPADVPDADLVAACDTSDNPGRRRTAQWPTNWRAIAGSGTIAPFEWTAFANGGPTQSARERSGQTPKKH